MNLEFAKYTDATKFAKKLDSDFYGKYEKVLICPDVKTVWVAKVLMGLDEDYNPVEDSVIIRLNKIDDFNAGWIKEFKADNLALMVLTADIDDGSDWDIEPCDDLEDAMDMLSGGFGIIEEED